jgi:hypothetical protein
MRVLRNPLYRVIARVHCKQAALMAAIAVLAAPPVVANAQMNPGPRGDSAAARGAFPPLNASARTFFPNALDASDGGPELDQGCGKVWSSDSASYCSSTGAFTDCQASCPGYPPGSWGFLGTYDQNGTAIRCACYCGLSCD